MPLFATEFSSIRPTRSFDAAIRAAASEADRRYGDSAVYEDGRLILVVYPSEQAWERGRELRDDFAH